VTCFPSNVFSIESNHIVFLWWIFAPVTPHKRSTLPSELTTKLPAYNIRNVRLAGQQVCATGAPPVTRMF